MTHEQLRVWVNDPARTRVELQTVATGLGLSTGGNTESIRNRILRHIAQQPDLTAQVPAAVVPAGWTAPAAPPAPAPAPAAPAAAPAPAATAQAAPATPGTLVEPYTAPGGYHWEPRERRIFVFRRGYELVLVPDNPPPAPQVHANNGQGDDMSRFFWGLAGLAFAVLAAILIIWALPEAWDQINDDDDGNTQVVYRCTDGREVASAAACSSTSTSGGTVAGGTNNTAQQQNQNNQQTSAPAQPSDTLAALQNSAVNQFGIAGQPSSNPVFWGPVRNVPGATNGYFYQGPTSKFNVPSGARADFQGHSCADKNSIGVYGPNKVEATTVTFWMVPGETSCPPGSPGFKG